MVTWREKWFNFWDGSELEETGFDNHINLFGKLESTSKVFGKQLNDAW